MNPDTKLVLDELSKLSKHFDDVESKLESRFSEHNERWESRFVESEDKWERKFADLAIAQETRVAVLERAAASFDDWRPGVEGTLDSVRLEVGKLSKHWERSVLDRGAPILETTSSAAGRSPSAGEADRPRGHCVETSLREGDIGQVTTFVHPPIKGMSPSPDPLAPSMNTQFHQFSGHPGYGAGSDASLGRLPKLNFPSFEGDNPKLWLSRSADFMELYRVPLSMWVKLASMHIIPPAARWLPSVESRLKSCTWVEFSKLLLDRFGREQHELLVRQFLTICQTASVSDYVERFATLVDQLAAYGSQSDPLYSTMRFINGLRDDLRAAVLIQRPADLDTAFVLAQLQEEVAPISWRKEVKKSDFSFQSKHSGGLPLPLPSPPGGDKLLAPDGMKTNDGGRPRSTDDRWRALRAQRRA